MNQIAVVFIRVIAPALGVLLGLLGFATLGANLLGWFLFIAGIVYAAGTVIVAYVLKRNFWESQATGLVNHAERGDRSFWLLAIAMIAVFYLSPLEFLYLNSEGLPVDWPEIAGACLAALGGGLFVWARRCLAKSYSGHLSTTEGQPLLQGGPYRFLRHPAYAGYLLAALGLTIGYASVWGFAALLVLLLPAVLWRIHVEEGLLSAHFGTQYQEYASRTRRLIPGLW